MTCVSGIIPDTGSRGKYPLIQVDYHLDVVDVNVHATVSQTYISTSQDAQAVTYMFPVPSDAAVCDFCAVMDDGRTVRGVVKERAEAQRDYVDAMSKGRTAGMLKQHSSQVFETSLGIIKPGSNVRIIIKFVSIVGCEGSLDSLRLRVPIAVVPIYGTPKDTIKAYAKANKLKTDDLFGFTASIQMPGKINSIESSTHHKALTRDFSTDTCARVSIRGGPSMLKSDILLEVKCDGLDSPRFTIQHFQPPVEDGKGFVTDAVSLTLVPRFQPVPVASQEYIFLVDRSGSMEGDRIRAVRAALQIMLRSLPTEGTRFNIFSFGKACDSLWPASVTYTQASVTEASRYVENMLADYGNTLIASALRRVTATRKNALKEPTSIFVLTDGAAWDMQAAYKAVADAVDESDRALRAFVLGVGKRVSTEMCEGIARAGKGVAAYVREKDALDAKLVGLLKAARNAPVQDLTVDWGVPFISGQDGLQQAPMQLGSLPPLYPGFRYSIFALIRRPRDSAHPAKVVVKGSAFGEPVALDVPAACVPSDEFSVNRVPFVHVLAARALVQNLEDDSARAHGNLDTLTKEKIAALGTTYGIVTSQTSFVAIDQDGAPFPRPVLQRPVLQRKYTIEIIIDPDEIPIPRAHISGSPGLGNVHGHPHSAEGLPANVRVRGSARPSPSEPEPPSERAPALSEATMLTSVAPVPQVHVTDPNVTTLEASFVKQSPPSEPAPQPQPATAATSTKVVTLETVARAQQVDGSFPDINSLRISSIAKPPGELVNCEVLWNTVLALALLQASFGSPDERAAWMFIGDKARKFVLEASVGDPMRLEEDKAEAMLDRWIAQAVKILGSRHQLWKLWKKNAVV